MEINTTVCSARRGKVLAKKAPITCQTGHVTETGHRVYAVDQLAQSRALESFTRRFFILRAVH